MFDRSEPHTGRYSDVLPSTGGLRVIYDLKINKFVMARPHGEGGLRVHVVCWLLWWGFFAHLHCTCDPRMQMGKRPSQLSFLWMAIDLQPSESQTGNDAITGLGGDDNIIFSTYTTGSRGS